MQQESFFQKHKTNIIIILIFIIVSAFYCLPQFQGYVLNAPDGVSWEAMSHEAATFKKETGENPMWSNSMFGGMPTYTYYLTGVKDLLEPLPHFVQGIIPNPMFLFLIAMVGFYVLALSLKMNKWIGAIGAIAYAFATYNPSLVSHGHVTKMISIGYFPGVIAGLLMIYNGKRLSGASIFALFFTLLIGLSHFQMVYYVAICIAFIGLAMAFIEIKNGRLKNFVISSVIAFVVAVICVGPSLPRVLATQEYTKYTMRGGGSELKRLKANSETKKAGGLDKEYAFRWSNSWGETFCFLVPQLYGGGSSYNLGTGSNYYETLTSIGVPEQYAEDYAKHANTYWGPQPFLAGPVYFGAIVCFLFILGMMIVQSPHKWWMLAVSIFGTLLSLGNHFETFNYFLFDYLPMYNKFRAPTMALVIPQLMFPFLAMWALNDIITGKVDKTSLLKKLKTATIITAGLAALIAIGSQMFFDFKAAGDAMLAEQFSKSANNPQVGAQLVKALVEDRASMAMISGLWSAVLILATAGLLWMYINERIKKQYLIGGLGFLIAIDMIPTAFKYLNKDHYVEETEYQAQFDPRPVDAQILKDPDPYYRVFDLSRNVYNDAMQAYHHKAIGGYSPTKMESYQDLIDVHLSSSFNHEVLNMLNTKYIIFTAGNGQITYQPNIEACGNAWFVSNVKYVNDADEEMESLTSRALGDTTRSENQWSAKSTAVIRNKNATSLQNKTNFVVDSRSNISLTKYGLNDLMYSSNNNYDGLAVFSDLYYDKGWKAYIDGKEAEILKVNYLLRGLQIPAGKHEIKFEFRPDSVLKTNTIAMISSLLVYALIGAALFMVFKKNKPINKEA
jgi:hypothetical protein